MLVFFASGRNLYGFLLNNERFSCWRVNSPADACSGRCKRCSATWAKSGRITNCTVKDLTDAKWKQSGRQVLDTLLKDSPADFSQPFDELVIVPDGILWYLPFEALQVRGRQEVAVVDLAVPHSLRADAFALHVGKGRAATRRATRPWSWASSIRATTPPWPRRLSIKLAEVVPGAVALRSPPPAPSSIYGTLFHRLIVFDDLIMLRSRIPTAGAWRRSTAASRARRWAIGSRCPGADPTSSFCPASTPPPKTSLKRPRRGAPGNEVFLSVCGLMANGSRTLLLSRWRTGGQTSFDLVREFAQELPHTSPADAWQRAVLLAMDSRLNFESEPRVKHGPTDEAPKASHPFFWAGYMLVDSGTPPKRPSRPPDGPVIKLKKPDKPARKTSPRTRRRTKRRTKAEGRKRKTSRRRTATQKELQGRSGEAEWRRRS